jgi:hypothetical protein
MRLAIDTLMMRDHYVEAFDKIAPDWREHYDAAGTLPGLHVFARKPAR